MTNERSSLITIGGEQYEMILTTRATKAISNRYGGLDNLGDKLMKSENMEMALDEIIWLITLLCNQSIEIYNLRNSEKKPLLTEETVELLTSPGELAEYKGAITEAMLKGTKRELRRFRCRCCPRLSQRRTACQDLLLPFISPPFHSFSPCQRHNDDSPCRPHDRHIFGRLR